LVNFQVNDNYYHLGSQLFYFVVLVEAGGKSKKNTHISMCFEDGINRIAEMFNY
jgi:hypothetical protein